MICMNNPNTFYRYKTKDYSECKAIISNWIKYADVRVYFVIIFYDQNIQLMQVMQKIMYVSPNQFITFF